MSKRWKNNRTGSDSWVYAHHDERRRQIIKRVGRHRRQRAERGFSWHDWINFDVFIAGVIANAAHDFRVKGQGYPAGMTIEAWNEILLRIETPLREWSEHKFDLDHEAGVRCWHECQKALKLFAEHFASFWD